LKVNPLVGSWEARSAPVFTRRTPREVEYAVFEVEVWHPFGCDYIFRRLGHGVGGIGCLGERLEVFDGRTTKPALLHEGTGIATGGRAAEPQRLELADSLEPHTRDCAGAQPFVPLVGGIGLGLVDGHCGVLLVMVKERKIPCFSLVE